MTTTLLQESGLGPSKNDTYAVVEQDVISMQRPNQITTQHMMNVRLRIMQRCMPLDVHQDVSESFQQCA